MSSLVPGPIFLSSGLNRNSTPTPPDITPAQLDERYRRVDFNGHDWPRDSPTSRIYDVANTSTKLIILNNKYGKNSTRLRGYYTGPKRPERHIDPDRHRAPSPRNPRFHTSCYNSSSPKFEPTLKTDLEWVNSSHRPPNALIGALLSLSDDYSSELDTVSLGRRDGRADTVSVNLSSVFEMPLDNPITVEKPKTHLLHEARSSVNPRRHATCLAPPDLPVHDDRPRSRMSILPNKYFTNSEYADMSMGEKIYMWSIEKIYNMEKMKQLKQEQYRKLLNMEAKKGYHGYQDYVRYMRYINSAKDRSYGTGTPSDKRSRSAHSQRSKSATSRSSPTKSETKSEDGLENERQDQPERPKTSLGHSRQEPLRDTQTSAGKTSTGNQRSQSKSPSPSRKSSAKSSAAGSQRSLRSGSRASSAVSRKSVEKTKGDHSDSSLTNGEDDAPQLHKEGKDRPKSRLGHPGIEAKDQAVAVGEETPVHHEGKDRPKSRLGHLGADDRDQDSIHSSSLSIKSDHSNLSSDSGVENGRKEKKPQRSSDTSSISSVENTNKRRNNQGEKKKKRQLELLKAKQSKNMGSRSSVNSRSSSRSDTEHARSGKGNKINERSVDKEKTEQEVKAESSDKDTKVHRIPSGTFVNEETTDTGKAGEGSDTNLNNDENDKKIETSEKKTSALEEENITDDNKVHSDDKTVENIIETEVAEQKHEDPASEKPTELENITNEEPRMEAKYESQNLDKTDAQEIEREGESNVQIKEDNSEQQQQQGQQQQKQQQLPEGDAGKDERERNKLSRQDSFEDDDDDRKVNRDLDKIEY